jgi:FkbM family methyltransferase
LLLSRLVGRAGRVVALEAHPRTYARLVELCKANDLTNVTTLQVAASDIDGRVAISDLDNHIRNTMLGAEGDGIDVPARRIETIAAELGITRIDLLKMNIEGAELPALRGLGELMARTQHVCISCHDFLAEAGGSDELRTKATVRDLLVDQGFRVFNREDAPDPWTRDYLYGVNSIAS